MSSTEHNSTILLSNECTKSKFKNISYLLYNYIHTKTEDFDKKNIPIDVIILKIQNYIDFDCIKNEFSEEDLIEMKNDMINLVNYEVNKEYRSYKSFLLFHKNLIIDYIKEKQYKNQINEKMNDLEIKKNIDNSKTMDNLIVKFQRISDLLFNYIHYKAEEYLGRKINAIDLKMEKFEDKIIFDVFEERFGKDSVMKLVPLESEFPLIDMLAIQKYINFDCIKSEFSEEELIQIKNDIVSLENYDDEDYGEVSEEDDYRITLLYHKDLILDYIKQKQNYVKLI